MPRLKEAKDGDGVAAPAEEPDQQGEKGEEDAEPSADPNAQTGTEEGEEWPDRRAHPSRDPADGFAQPLPKG